jgi:lysophospholipase L1-like esterase
MSERAKKSILFFCSTFLAICLLEFGLRIIDPLGKYPAGTMGTPKADLYGWALPPNTKMTYTDPNTGQRIEYQTNSNGWKDIEHQFAKPEGIFRILFLGDSITAGRVHPNDLYTTKVRELLLERQVTNVEVISIGIGGWGTDQILEVLKLEGLDYEPDLVIYQLNPNDLTDNLSPTETTPLDNIRWHKPFKYEIRDGQLVRIAVESLQSSGSIRAILMRSAILSNLAQVVDSLQNRLEKISGATRDDENWWDDFPNHPVTPIRYYSGEQTPAMNKAWELIAALILEMKNTVESNGARFVIFTTAGDEGYRQWNIQHEWLYSDENGDFILWEENKYPVNWDRQLEIIEQIAKRYDIPLIKPVRSYERYDNDAHPNEKGNLNMALDIVDYLLEGEGSLQTSTPP